MKKLVFSISLAILMCLLFAFSVGAATVYLEEIPNELKISDEDAVTHFVVFEDEKYFTVSGTAISGLNTDNIAADMADAGIDSTKIGTEYLTRFNFPEGITSINLEVIKGNQYFSNVAGYVQLPSTLLSVDNLRGHCSQVRCVDFGENTQLTSIGAYFCEGASKLMAVKNFPTNLTLLGGYAFNGCYNAFKGELYINATTIGEQAFNNAIANVTKLTFGPNVTSIGNQSLTARLTEFTSGKPADEKIQIAEIEFQCDVSAVTFKSNAFYFGGPWARSPYSKLEKIYLSHPNNEKLVNEGTSVLNDFTASTVLFDETDGSAYYVTPVHTFAPCKVVYDSFLSYGATEACSNCGALTKNRTAEPIFTYGGYSVPTDGTISISVRYNVNFEALNAYEEAYGTELDYGLVVAIKSTLGGNAPLDENGQITGGSTIKVDIPNTYSSYEIKVANMSEAHKEIELILCSYIKETDSEGNTHIVYLEDAQKAGDKLSGVTYKAYYDKAISENA